MVNFYEINSLLCEFIVKVFWIVTFFTFERNSLLWADQIKTGKNFFLLDATELLKLI